jgi:hypothetical protein
MMRVKINDEFKFPLEMDLTLFQEVAIIQEVLYELQAIVVHCGTADTGHYYMCTRDSIGEYSWNIKEPAGLDFPFPTQNEKLKTGWFEVNDALSKPISLQEIKKLFGERTVTPNATTLFYRLKPSKSQNPTIPTGLADRVRSAAGASAK